MSDIPTLQTLFACSLHTISVGEARVTVWGCDANVACEGDDVDLDEGGLA